MATDIFESSFHFFSLLPTELRLEIWSLNLPETRIVTVRCEPRPTPRLDPNPETVGRNDRGTREVYLMSDDQSIDCTSPCSIPTNLHACHESRIEALRHYKLLFGVAGQPGKIYFNPLKDALYFGVRDGFAAGQAHLDAFMTMITPSDRSLVQHVAINEELSRNGSPFDRRNFFIPRGGTEKLVGCQMQARFRNLKQLTFVCNDSNPIYSSDATFVEPYQKNRLVERQVQTAVQTIRERYPRFATPSWSIRAIAAEPNPPKYDQRVLGYRGPRSRLFGPPCSHGNGRARASWQCACNGCGDSTVQLKPSYATTLLS
ncbi:hypothetical protein GGR57DRAFT_31899 [Xylariaceae sp. FL1272]|nr:hypothetical protein GGR57DRAFT_31899 [Xylariaceae sp. FL1272]